jgi:hypothetical protein
MSAIDIPIRSWTLALVMEVPMAHAFSRRHTLLLGASTGLALASLSNRALFAAEAAQDIKDEDIFKFALNLGESACVTVNADDG